MRMKRIIWSILTLLAAAQIAGAQQLIWTNTGAMLEFSWTGNWNLQSQTNTLGIGITTHWFDYPGGNTSPVAVPIDALNQACFFRLESQPATNSCSTTHLVISEVQSRGPNGASDEFVELYNPTQSSVTLDGTWTLQARSSTATSYTTRWTGSGNAIPPFGHFLIAGSAYTRTPAADATLASGITDASSLRLLQAGTVVDALCYGYDSSSTAQYSTDPTFTCEGSPVANNPHNNSTTTDTDGSLERKPGGSSGNCTDTGNNADDFFVSPVSNPQSTTSPLVVP